MDVVEAADALRRLASGAAARSGEGVRADDRDGFLFGREFPLMLDHYIGRIVSNALQAIEVDSRPKTPRRAAGVSSPIVT
jgi:predicted lipid carrier protein YhbT